MNFLKKVLFLSKKINFVFLVLAVTLCFAGCDFDLNKKKYKSIPVQEKITINGKTYEKTGEAVIIPPNTSVFLAVNDDSSWSCYYANGNSNFKHYNDYKGVFLKGRKICLLSFAMGKYEVTQELYEAVMGKNPSVYHDETLPEEKIKLHPVESIHWYHAIAFCNKLSIMQGLDPVYEVAGWDFKNITHDMVPNIENPSWDNLHVCLYKNGYRLPTEAEWEFTARGGNMKSSVWNYAFAGCQWEGVKKGLDKRNFYKVAKDPNLSDYAWYLHNSSNTTHEVGTRLANSLGIFDMSGNVSEFCYDKYSNDAAENDEKSSQNSNGVVINPIGASEGGRILRGGNKNSIATLCCISHREEDGEDEALPPFGFRLCRTLIGR
ncbi:MAG: formylglycine-generating enzyme family protein [Treponemataceae bacterium]